MISGVPTWLFAIILTLLFELGVEAGWVLYGIAMGKRAEASASTGAGYVASASLVLLSLLIAFTLAMAVDRYELRRRLVVDEADAISTVWLRDQVLEQPYRGRLEALLRDYVRERRTLPPTGQGAVALDAADRRAMALETPIWDETLAALRTPAASPFATVVIQGATRMFDLPAERRAAVDAQVPGAVLWTLVFVAFITSILTGYGLRAGRHRHRVASVGMFAAAALSITLILELDEPSTGFIRVPQAPLDRVATFILTAPHSGQ